MLDKIKGALFGFAIGDALGAPTEFMTKEEVTATYGFVKEFIGGGWLDLEPGETTDDTDMTIAVAKGIIEHLDNPIEAMGKHFLKWNDSRPKDIGITIRTVFRHYEGDWFQAAKTAHDSLSGKSAGNGSLMRCLPVALAYSEKAKMEEITVLQSKMTHYDDLAAEACVIYNHIARQLLEGHDLHDAIRNQIKQTRYESDFSREPDCLPDGFVVNTMKWVLYWLMNCETFEEVVQNAANRGEDSDTVAAIAGGLKGLEVGFSKLPYQYHHKLYVRDSLGMLSNVLTVIRDQKSSLTPKDADILLIDLKRNVKQVIQLVEQKSPYEEQLAHMELINKQIYLFRSTLNENDADFEAKRHTCSLTVNRFNRSLRLLHLGAPNIIKLNELTWLSIMIDHMEKRHTGIEPVFTAEQQEDFDTTIKMELEFDKTRDIEDVELDRKQIYVF